MINIPGRAKATRAIGAHADHRYATLIMSSKQTASQVGVLESDTDTAKEDLRILGVVTGGWVARVDFPVEV
ncbi:hypothetical protein, partial [Catellatospora chokoriensis]|uniref:hypothetical protein n=1 Tax=Catellatospora chokoriensis TaxID=310353 RepID=UPI001945A52E